MFGLFRWARAEVLHSRWKRGKYTPPDRRLLEGEILPAVANEADAVLFVGVQWYTERYLPIFEGKTFATIEPNAELAKYGARHHAVDVVQNLGGHFPGITFDAVIMNGVIGYGLDDVEKIDAALAACAARMRSGGLLILGVNEEKPSHIDPRTAKASALFEESGFAQFPARVVVEVPFRERTHSFLFWKKK